MGGKGCGGREGQKRGWEGRSGVVGQGQGGRAGAGWEGREEGHWWEERAGVGLGRAGRQGWEGTGGMRGAGQGWRVEVGWRAGVKHCTESFLRPKPATALQPLQSPRRKAAAVVKAHDHCHSTILLS